MGEGRSCLGSRSACRHLYSSRPRENRALEYPESPTADRKEGTRGKTGGAYKTSSGRTDKVVLSVVGSHVYRRSIQCVLRLPRVY
jgi:hypothetical protein